MTNLIAMAKSAKVASHKVSTLPAEKKNETLSAIASELETQAQTVLAQNGLDIKDARSSGLSDALVDRLLLTPERIEGLAADTCRLIDLPDPVGTETESKVLPNGMRLARARCCRTACDSLADAFPLVF